MCPELSHKVTLTESLLRLSRADKRGIRHSIDCGCVNGPKLGRIPVIAGQRSLPPKHEVISCSNNRRGCGRRRLLFCSSREGVIRKMLWKLFSALSATTFLRSSYRSMSTPSMIEKRLLRQRPPAFQGTRGLNLLTKVVLRTST